MFFFLEKETETDKEANITTFEGSKLFLAAHRLQNNNQYARKVLLNIF